MSTTATERASWTGVGADASAQQTYGSIKAALKDVTARRGLDIFLQGSYANHTNIRVDSDVDVVAMTKLAYVGTPERLNPTGKLVFALESQSDFSQHDLRNEVYAALVSYYGASLVDARNKCIRVRKRPGYVDADVVPCFEHHYFEQGSSSTSTYIEGINIQPLRGASIVNFPKEHIKNGQIKNYLCTNRYKPTVRQMKRLRNRAVDLGLLTDGFGPGYLLECMTFNVPNEVFVPDDAQRLWDVVRWLYLTDTKRSFASCDEVHTLFGSDPGDFTVDQAEIICKALWDAL